MDTALSLYCPLVKVDRTQRLVYGYASTEALDAQGEIVSRAALGKALPDYMRFGNIREMHQLSAIGKTKQAELDEKGLYIVAKIVDDTAWTKVKEGVYAGFSIGGKKIAKQGQTITSLSLSEISLVDRPANPECVIELAKVASPLRKVEEREDVSEADKQRAESQYGDVDYADEKNKKYPIDTEAHIRAAWNYLAKEKNAKKYSAEDLKTIKSRVISAWKKKIDTAGPPSADEGKVAKSMYGIAQLAALIQALEEFRTAIQIEAELEGDESEVPGQVSECLADLCACLRDYVAEETAEMTGEADEEDVETMQPDAEMTQQIETMKAIVARWPARRALRKAGARHSKSDQDKVDAIHQHADAIAQHAQALGSQYRPDGEDPEKEAEAENESETVGKRIRTAATDSSRITARLASLERENARFQKRIAELEAEPTPARGALRVVAKGDDYVASDQIESEPSTAIDAIKQAHRRPFTIGGR